MSWTDEATEKQYSALYWMLSTHMMPDEVKSRMDWIRNQKLSRKQMSTELGRVRELCTHGKSLVVDEEGLATWFDSPIWKDY